jgi:hypothetical protein
MARPRFVGLEMRDKARVGLSILATSIAIPPERRISSVFFLTGGFPLRSKIEPSSQVNVGRGAGSDKATQPEELSLTLYPMSTCNYSVKEEIRNVCNLASISHID